MAGKIKQMVDTIIAKRSAGNPTVATLTRAKLVMKGINPEVYTSSSPDDPAVIDKLQRLASDLGISL